ncbi:hypothetical protein LOZ58_001473 [Ophidiomyces ophidiicola]|nr:hypothetical protein LOZ58_001473 [Ophidiomyces ophidiicola]
MSDRLDASHDAPSSPSPAAAAGGLSPLLRDHALLSPLEQEVLDEYARLLENMTKLSDSLAYLASQPAGETLDALRLLERKTATVYTLLKASVYSIVLQQQIYHGEGDRLPSPRLAVPLASNNPFRNRTSSPANDLLAPATPKARPMSTNPFLDDAEARALQAAGTTAAAPPQPSKQRSDVADHASQLFDSLSLDAPPRPKDRRPSSQPKDKDARRSPRKHSHDDVKARRPANTTTTTTTSSSHTPLIDVFADPQDSKLPASKRRERRRRNSESSVMERPKALDAEDDRRRREQKPKDRDGKHRERSHRSRKNNSYKLDIIDKLDVTSVYGGVFHHDGPFDACNPHRNRKNLRNAPMQAFPKDSRNMALGGAGPNNSELDLNLFHGRGEEGYADFSKSTVRPERFDPTARVEPIHGAESMGLGTSTFLEGAPASRAAIERRQSENEVDAVQAGNGALQRKKSLAQKIRGINTRGGAAGRVTSPEPLLRVSPIGSGKRTDKNPFFQDYDEAYDLKSARIQEVVNDAKKDAGPRPRSASSPKSMERRNTNDGVTPSHAAAAAADAKPSSSGAGIGGGLMNRMKSLRRPRPERRTTVTDSH